MIAVFPGYIRLSLLANDTQNTDFREFEFSLGIDRRPRTTRYLPAFETPPIKGCSYEHDTLFPT